MSDFILPDDLNHLAHHVSQDIADGWAMLSRLCVLRQVPMDMAEAQVVRYVNRGLSELEALRKVYKEISYG